MLIFVVFCFFGLHGSWVAFWIEFSSILAPFWAPFGWQKRQKIDQRRHRKSNEKKKSTWMSQKSQNGQITPRGRVGPDPREGGRGRGKPLPREVVGGIAGGIFESKPP